MKLFSPVVAALAVSGALVLAQSPTLPSMPMTYGDLTVTFRTDGTFTMGGGQWPTMTGSWKAANGEAAVTMAPMADLPEACTSPGRYRFRADGRRLSFELVSDKCEERTWIFDNSSWLPVGERPEIPPRHVTRIAGATGPLPAAAPAAGSWPSFRGAHALGIADGQHLPDTWNVDTGENILWRMPIAGLAHSSPVIWGDTIFLTTAVSSRADATFKPGIYGAGTPSDDRTAQQWKVIALDKKSGTVKWERVAAEGPPLDKRHVKSTYASGSPATNGQIVVASFGSMGVHAFDVNGQFRWKVDYGKIMLGAFDLPGLEWGPASSPIIWNDLVILQVDTQQDSFLLALKVDTGETVWKTERDEIPSWGTPTVADTPAGPMLVTNASNFVRGYDPRSGRELWRLGRSSRLTAPTPIFADGLWVISSGRGPERPIFVVRPEARGDVTPPDGETSSAGVVWSKTARGPYMPSPIAYGGVLYVLANAGIFDAHDVKTGRQIYRQRLPDVGNGFSASPVAADGKLYLSSEDGDILVVAAGDQFSHIATNAMNDLVMATPALSEGVMYVRSAKYLTAVGRK